jgi:hypothetical protein
MAKPRVAGMREPTEEEKALDAWFAEQALASPDNLEAAARTVVGLVTGLLGLLLGVLSVGEEPLPAALSLPWLGYLGAAAVALLLVALLFALGVLLPRRMALSSHRPDRQRAAFARMLARKARWLTCTVVAFGLGLLLLGAILIAALFQAM